MGALTIKKNMYAYRNWEIKTQFFTDITSSEGLLLKVDSCQTGIRVHPKISNQFSFRWISDFTRFYYYTLEYNHKSNSHTTVGSLFTPTNVIALSKYNITNLITLLFKKVKNITYKTSKIATTDIILELSKKINSKNNIIPFNKLSNVINEPLMSGNFNLFTDSFIVKNMIKLRESVKEHLNMSFISRFPLNMQYGGNVFSLFSLLKHITKPLTLFTTINQKKYISSLFFEKIKLVPTISLEINSLVLNNFTLLYLSSDIIYSKKNNIDFIYNRSIPWINSQVTIIRYDSKTYPLLYHLDDKIYLLIFQTPSYLYTGGYGWNVFGKYFINLGFSNIFSSRFSNFPNLDIIL